MFIETLLSDPAHFFIVVGVVVVSVCLHEFAHALVAWSQGDPTAKDQGYLTLNPWKHMGPYSLVLLAVAGIAWGQTPVMPSRFHHALSPAWVSLAGPLMNLFLMILFVLLLRFAELDPLTMAICSTGALINAVLFLFNLIPVPPLDGFTVLETLVPSLRRYASVLHQYGFIALLIGFFLLPLGNVLFDGARWIVKQALTIF